MPNLKSSKKSVKTEKKQQVANTAYTSKVKNAMKKLDKAVKEKDNAKAKEELKTVIKNIDKCTSKGLIKKNKAARDKSKLMKSVNEVK